MRLTFIWTDGDNGNIAHIAEHGVSSDEAEDVVEHAQSFGRNRRGDPVAFGFTAAGRHLAVPFIYLDDACTIVYVWTAYDTEPRHRS